VSRRRCNPIERETTPNYYKLFNEFSPWALRLTLDAIARAAGFRMLVMSRIRHVAIIP
jgi:hypothetical protein